jgi:cytochrome P450
MKERVDIKIKHPINITSKEATENKLAYYKWLLEEAPVYKGKASIMNVYFVSRYEDCVAMLKDPRFVRNRSTATGGRRIPIPFPIPKSTSLVFESRINEDEPNHRRLRNLVHKAFTARAISKLGARIETLTHELLDKAEAQGEVDLMQAYSQPIPVTVISEMLGVDSGDMPKFIKSLRSLTKSITVWNMLRGCFWYLPQSVKFVRELIVRKQQNPQDDILTGLIQAEDEGDKLSEDELVSMVFLLTLAGYETTLQLINCAVVTLLDHPDQLQRLRDQPELIESAIEEVLRYSGPIYSTEWCYAREEATIQGVTIPKGATVIPLVGAANRDPAVFENPDLFDITRTPNRHLGFGRGIHYCLGAPLARLETKIALTTLLERNPNLRLAVDSHALKLQRAPLFDRYTSIPVVLG